MTDPRPANCRHRLQDEGKAHPKSGCQVAGCGGVFGPSKCEPGAGPLPEAPAAPVPLEYTSTEVPRKLYERFREEFGYLQQAQIQRMCVIAMEEAPTFAGSIITADMERLNDELGMAASDKDYHRAAEIQSILYHLDNLAPRLRGEPTKAHT